MTEEMIRKVLMAKEPKTEMPYILQIISGIAIFVVIACGFFALGWLR